MLQVVQFVLIISILWLAGFRNGLILAYIFLLYIFLFFVYFVYRYIVRRKLYARLTTIPMQIDELFVSLGQAPLAVSLQQLLQQQSYLYTNKIASLQAKQQEQLIFIDRWVHQMKTPLSVIELMTDEVDEPVAINLREETERLATGLETALYMSRFRHIEQDFNVKRVNLSDIVKQVVSDNKRLFIRHNVFPKIKAEQTLFVETDEKWLRFILDQLIHNAVKYSASQTNRLFLTMEAHDGHRVLSITDYGIGIPREDLQRIFNPFYTGRNGRLYRESTGVGLYLVKEVANFLGHEITVRSEIGIGTTFKIIFK